jgi:hypothetical protein
MGPDQVHEAMRDLTRARMAASMQLSRARQQLLAFLLRHGRIYETGKHWTFIEAGWPVRLSSSQLIKSSSKITSKRCSLHKTGRPSLW